MDRRGFLCIGGGALSATLLGRLQAYAAAPPASMPLRGAGIPADGWLTLGAVQEQLLPSEPNAPGAKEVNALGYLHFVMTWKGIDPEEPRILRSGLQRLRQIELPTLDRPFMTLDSRERDQVLRAVEAGTGGTQWIMLLLDYVFEALLADPVYGGNPDGIGWRWLRIEPGHRRPGVDQRYFVL